MLIVCPNCATSYDVDLASLQPDGRRVRCVRCRTIWHAELPHNEKLIAAAEALAPVQRMVETVADAAAAETAFAAEPSAEQFDTAPSAEAEPLPEIESDPSVVALSPAAEEAADRPAAEEPSIEVESPPIAPAEAEGEEPSVDVEAEPHVSSAEPLEDIETIAARRFPRYA